MCGDVRSDWRGCGVGGAPGKELGEMTPLAETIEASTHAPIETRCLSQFDEARGVEVGPEAVDPAASQASSVSDASHISGAVPGTAPLATHPGTAGLANPVLRKQRPRAASP